MCFLFVFGGNFHFLKILDGGKLICSRIKIIDVKVARFVVCA